eukprot:COSAG01_NODE_17060_length_1181_cov_38.377079_1_plen_48_part_00
MHGLTVEGVAEKTTRGVIVSALTFYYGPLSLLLAVDLVARGADHISR